MALMAETRSQDAVEHAGRAGFVAKGVLYGIVGIITGSIAFGGGGEQASQTGALKALSESAYGTVILALLTLGLIGYALLMAVYLIRDPMPQEGLKGMAHRASYGVRSVIYGGLAVIAGSLVVGSSSSGGGATEQTLTRRALELPAGRWLVGVAALVLFGVAATQIGKAVTGSFMQLVEGVDQRVRHHVRWTGIVGHIARGVVFGTIGVLLTQAALQSDPSEAGGVDRAINEIAGLPFGTVALLVVAAGLLCYGAFCLAVGRWGSLKSGA